MLVGCSLLYQSEMRYKKREGIAAAMPSHATPRKDKDTVKPIGGGLLQIGVSVESVAVIIEVAAMNNRQRKMGYNAARELFAALGLEYPEEEEGTVKTIEF